MTGSKTESTQAKKNTTEDYYCVEKILGHHKRGDSLYFYVSWEGYSEESNSWVSEDWLRDGVMQTQYRNAHLKEEEDFDTPSLPDDCSLTKIINAIGILQNGKSNMKGVSKSSIQRHLGNEISGKTLNAAIADAMEAQWIVKASRTLLNLSECGRKIIHKKKKRIIGKRKKKSKKQGRKWNFRPRTRRQSMLIKKKLKQINEPAKKKRKKILKEADGGDADMEFIEGFSCEYCYQTSSTIFLRRSIVDNKMLCHACQVHERKHGGRVPRIHGRLKSLKDITPQSCKVIAIYRYKNSKVYDGIVTQNGKRKSIGKSKSLDAVKKKVIGFVQKIRPCRRNKRDNKRKRSQSTEENEERTKRQKSNNQDNSEAVERKKSDRSRESSRKSMNDNLPWCEHCGNQNETPALHQSISNPDIYVCFQCFLHDSTARSLPARRSKRLSMQSVPKEPTPQPSPEEIIEQSSMGQFLPLIPETEVKQEAESDEEGDNLTRQVAHRCPQTEKFLSLLSDDPTYRQVISELRDANLSFTELHGLEDEQMVLIGISHPLKMNAFRKKLNSFKAKGTL